MKAILLAVLLILGTLGCYSGVGYTGYQGDQPGKRYYYSRTGTDGNSYGAINVNPSGYYWGHDSKAGTISGYIYTDPQRVRYSRSSPDGFSNGTVTVNPSGYYRGFDSKAGAVSGYIHTSPGD